MHERLTDRIVEQMETRSDYELAAIWSTHDQSKWSQEAFEAVRRVLEKRGIPLPAIGAPVAPRAEPASDGSETVSLNDLLRGFANRFCAPADIEHAGLALWNVHYTRSEEQDGWARAIGHLFGPGGALLGAVLLAAKTELVGEVGVLAVDADRVVLLKLGQMPLAGKSVADARVPLEAIAQKLRTQEPSSAVAFRPVTASASGDSLTVSVMGKAMGASDKAFGEDGCCLSVRTISGAVAGGLVAAETLADAICKRLMYAPPEDAVAAIVSSEWQPIPDELEEAFSDADYRQTFVRSFSKLPRDVTSALVLAARRDDGSIRELVEQCLRCYEDQDRLLSRLFGYASGFVLAGGGIAIAAAVVDGLARGWQTPDEWPTPLDAADKAWIVFLLGVVAPMLLWGGAALLLGQIRLAREAGTSGKRLLAEGRGFGGSLDGFLALVALGRDCRSYPDCRYIENEMRLKPAFRQRLCEVLRNQDGEQRREFLTSVPSGLSDALIDEMLAYEGWVPTSAVLRYVCMWLPCLAFGIYSVMRGFTPGALSLGDWLALILGIFIGFGGGGIPVVVLCIQQISAWRSRWWVRRTFCDSD